MLKDSRKIGCLFLVLFLAIAGCKKSTSKTDAQVAEETKIATKFFIDLPANDKVQHYIHESSSFTNECSVLASETDAAKKDITCYVEADELDLFFAGASFRYNVPPSMCSYLSFRPYQYYAYEPGGVSGSVTFTTLNGALVNVDLSQIDPPGSVFSKGGQELGCIYDYTSHEGPNCCYGKIMVNTIAMTSKAAPAVGVDTATSTLEKDFGGKYANCLAGPAMDTQPKNRDGYPMSDLIYVDTGGLTKNYDIASPIGKNYSSNVHAANYYSSAAPPTFLAPLINGWPLPSQPKYELVCLDRAMEILSRIQLQVREWNQLAEFAKKSTGNPDTYGYESGYLGSSLRRINDKADVDDFVPSVAIASVPTATTLTMSSGTLSSIKAGAYAIGAFISPNTRVVSTTSPSTITLDTNATTSGVVVAPVLFADAFMDPVIVTGNATATSNLLTVLSSTVGIAKGMSVYANDIPAGTKVTNVIRIGYGRNGDVAAGNTSITGLQTIVPSATTTLGSTWTNTSTTVTTTITRTCSTTSGSAVANGAGCITTDLAAGEAVTGTGIPAGTTIQSIDNGTQITLSQNAGSTAAVALTFTVGDTGDLTPGMVITDVGACGFIPVGTKVVSVIDASSFSVDNAATGTGVCQMRLKDNGTADYQVGMVVSGSGIQDGTRISTITDATTVVVNQAPTISATTWLTFLNSQVEMDQAAGTTLDQATTGHFMFVKEPYPQSAQ